MSLGKKVFFLLVTLVILIVYTVSTFNYRTILNDGENQTASFSSEDTMFGEYADLAITKINELKFSALKTLGLDKEVDLANKQPISLELLKDQGVVLMNGTFKDEEQVKSVVDLLNINRNGEYDFSNKGI